MKNILKKSYFVKSFRLDRRFFYVLLLDLAYLIIFLILVGFFLNLGRSEWAAIEYINPSIERLVPHLALGGLNISDPQTRSDTKMIHDASYSFFGKLGMVILGFIITTTLVTGFFKSRVWSIILKEKLNLKFFLRFSLLVLIYNLFWILLFILFIFGIKGGVNSVMVMIGIVLFSYINFIIYPVFAIDKNITPCLISTLRLVFLKLYLIIFRLIAVLFILFILFQLLTAFFMANMMVSFIIMLSILFIFMAWFKFYFIEILKKEV